MDLMVFPDAEELLRVALQIQMSATFGINIPVSTRIPTSVSEFIRIERTGGVQRNLVTDEPTLVVEAWATTDTRAHDLAQKVRALIHWFTEINGYAIHEVSEFSGPMSFPDAGVSESPRYSATYAIAIRGRSITI